MLEVCILFLVYLKNAVTNSMSHGRVMNEEGIGKDMEGNTCDPF